MPLTPEERRTGEIHAYYERFDTERLLGARASALEDEAEIRYHLARQRRERVAIEFVLKRRGALPPATLPRKEDTP